MKLLEALKNVDQSEQNSTWIDAEEIYKSLGIDPWECERPADFEDRLKQYWLVKWYCSDTWVGTTAIFLDGELVGMTRQVARKSDTDLDWISREAATKVWEWLKPKMAKISGYVNPDEDIDERYSVSYVSQILQDDGFYEDQPATLVRDELFLRNARSYQFDGDGQDITIQFHDGVRKRIHVTDFQFALALRKDAAQ